MLLDAHDQLMRRAEKIKVELASDLHTIDAGRDSPWPPGTVPGAVFQQADKPGNGAPDPPRLRGRAAGLSPITPPSSVT